MPRIRKCSTPPQLWEKMRTVSRAGRRRRAAAAARGLTWGGTAETRWIIGVMIEHDLYHAGEVNHVSALHQGTDRWEWE